MTLVKTSVNGQSVEFRLPAGCSIPSVNDLLRDGDLVLIWDAGRPIFKSHHYSNHAGEIKKFWVRDYAFVIRLTKPVRNLTFIPPVVKVK